MPSDCHCNACACTVEMPVGKAKKRIEELEKQVSELRRKNTQLSKKLAELEDVADIVAEVKRRKTKKGC